jgi:hypothetical protein
MPQYSNPQEKTEKNRHPRTSKRRGKPLHPKDLNTKPFKFNANKKMNKKARANKVKISGQEVFNGKQTC